MKNSIFKYFKLFYLYLGNYIYVAFILTILAGLIESIGILMLMPLFAFLGGDGESGIQTDSNWIVTVVDTAIGILGLNGKPTLILTFIFMLFLLKAFINFAALGINAWLRANLLKRLKKDTYTHLAECDIKYYYTKDTGTFLNLLTEQTNASIRAFHSFASFINFSFVSIIFLTMAFTLSPIFTSMTLVIGLLIYFAFKKLNAIVTFLSRARASENSKLSQNLVQVVTGFKYLRSTGMLHNITPNIATNIEKLASIQKNQGIAGAFTTAIKEPIVVLVLVVALFIQISNSQFEFEQTMVTVAFLYRMIGSVVALQSHWQSMLDNIGSFELVHSELTQLKQNKNTAETLPQKSNKSEHLNFSKIEFLNVHFFYTPAKPIIKNLNFTIKRNETLAIIGSSGSGKSTVIDLLTGIIKPTRGKILIDGVDLKTIDARIWRNTLGLVTQDNVLFDGTIMQNVTLNFHDDDTLNIDRLLTAIKLASFDEVVELSPLGLRTQVGDRGLMLSGGQKQRLVIAREIFRTPRLMILDEATSALDKNTEEKVQQNLDELAKNATFVIVAHRLSTIRNAHNIICIEDGQKVAEGTFKELLNQGWINE